MTNCESNARQPGWQTRGRVPTHARTVLIRVCDDKAPICMGFYDGKWWRHKDRTYVETPVIGYAELDDIAWLIDAIGQPADS